MATMQPSELRRHKERGLYDLDAISALFSDCHLAHVAYVRDGIPECLPMIALVHTVGDNTAIYLHGHPSAGLMETVRQNPKDSEGNDVEKVKVCVTATKVDGLVLSSAPNGHTFNYRSAVVHGECTLVSDLEVKRDIMKGVTNHIIAGRWEDVNPVASFQVSLVCVIRVDILSLSMKIRKGKPGIQPRNIEKDGPDHEIPVWTGTVPLYEVLDQPVASGLTEKAQIPPGLTKFIEERNEKHKSHSMSVAK